VAICRPKVWRGQLKKLMPVVTAIEGRGNREKTGASKGGVPLREHVMGPDDQPRKQSQGMEDTIVV